MQGARDAFEESGNPIHAWEAFGLARKAHRPVPASVLVYFERVAAEMSSLARHRVPRTNQVAKAVASAVGLTCRGRSNPFTEWNRKGHELGIAMDVYLCDGEKWLDQRTRGVVGNKWKAICEAGAERHNKTCACGRPIGWKTAERYFRLHAKAIIPPHLQLRSKSQKVADILR